ncbi:hypothetical protein [Pseudaminobacter sp. NGMCC 1.201702]|uniref:hypothetical protein n=1 Tax=Pseudaminobacter sp. NGMCC 1.201702 TaxID=3391825 RepID=UPI0039EFBD0D
MRVQVMPAKRSGSSKTIFDRPVREEDIHPGEDDHVAVSVLADGIYRDKSKYRYTFELSEAEIRAILAANAR